MKVTIKMDMTGDTTRVEPFLQNLSDDLFDYVKEHGFELKSIDRNIEFEEGEAAPAAMAPQEPVAPVAEPVATEPVLADMSPMEKLKVLSEKIIKNKKEELQLNQKIMAISNDGSKYIDGFLVKNTVDKDGVVLLVIEEKKQEKYFEKKEGLSGHKDRIANKLFNKKYSQLTQEQKDKVNKEFDKEFYAEESLSAKEKLAKISEKLLGKKEEKLSLEQIWEEADKAHSQHLNKINTFSTDARIAQYPEVEIEDFLKKKFTKESAKEFSKDQVMAIMGDHKKGMTLPQIAQKYNTTVGELKLRIFGN